MVCNIILKHSQITKIAKKNFMGKDIKKVKRGTFKNIYIHSSRSTEGHIHTVCTHQIFRHIKMSALTKYTRFTDVVNMWTEMSECRCEKQPCGECELVSTPMRPILVCGGSGEVTP